MSLKLITPRDDAGVTDARGRPAGDDAADAGHPGGRGSRLPRPRSRSSRPSALEVQGVY